MQEKAAEPAAHHPVGGHRRVDAAGHEHHTAAAHPHRQPALPRHPLGEHEHLVLVHLDEHRGIGLGKVDPEPVRLLDLPSDQYAQLSRGERETLVAPARAHREGAGLALGQRHRGGGDRLGRLRHPQRQAHPGDAGHVPHPLRDLAHGPRPGLLAALLAVGNAEQDDALPLAQVDRHAEVAHGDADVAVQDSFELLPVPPLEHDLAQLDQHARLIRGGELWHSPSVPAEDPYPEQMVVLLPGPP